MPPLRFMSFSGVRPRIDPTNLGDTLAQVAVNCRLDSTKTYPFRSLLDKSTAFPAGTKTIYPYNNGWLSWTDDVFIVPGPIADDQYNRIYYTGSGAPKVRGILTGVEREWDLGVVAPATAPTVTLQAKTATAWTKTWNYFYEETDGTQKDAGSLTVTETVVGTTFTAAVPARVTATATARFVAWLQASSPAGVILGRVYPTSSQFAGNSDLRIDGAIVTCNQVIVSTTATMSLLYDTSSSSSYTNDRAWVYTFVTVFGEESAPCSPTPVTAMTPTQDAYLTALEVPPISGNITKKRIYRTVTGDTGTTYKFVAEIDASLATYLDNVLDADTAETLPSSTWEPPPADLSCLVSMPGEFLAGISGRNICFSVPGYPHAWPSEYRITLDYDGVGLGVQGNSLVVATKGNPVLIPAVDPESATAAKIPSSQPCVSAKGVAEYNGAVVYPSDDGLVTVTGGAAVIFTEAYFSKAQWQALGPSTMKTHVYDNRLYLVTDTKTFVFIIGAEDSAMVELSDHFTAAHSHTVDDALYVVKADQLYRFDAGTDYLEQTWRSKEFYQPRPAWFSVARVNATGYPVTLNGYANGLKVFSVPAVTDQAFRLPHARPEKQWSFEIVGRFGITELMLGQSMGDI
jgi:hypothetical protein